MPTVQYHSLISMHMVLYYFFGSFLLLFSFSRWFRCCRCCLCLSASTTTETSSSHTTEQWLEITLTMLLWSYTNVLPSQSYWSALSSSSTFFGGHDSGSVISLKTITVCFEDGPFGVVINQSYSHWFLGVLVQLRIEALILVFIKLANSFTEYFNISSLLIAQLGWNIIKLSVHFRYTLLFISLRCYGSPFHLFGFEWREWISRIFEWETTNHEQFNWL